MRLDSFCVKEVRTWLYAWYVYLITVEVPSFSALSHPDFVTSFCKAREAEVKNRLYSCARRFKIYFKKPNICYENQQLEHDDNISNNNNSNRFLCVHVYASPRHRFHIINEKLFWCSYGNESLRAHVAAIAEKCNPDYQKISFILKWLLIL